MSAQTITTAHNLFTEAACAPFIGKLLVAYETVSGAIARTAALQLLKLKHTTPIQDGVHIRKSEGEVREIERHGG